MSDLLTVRTVVTGDVARITVAGDVDWDSAEELRTALTVALAAQPPPARLEVDMTAVDFCDSAGLRALIAAWKQGTDQGTTLTVVAASTQVTGLLQITGLDQALAAYGTTSS
jgi:anti-anti-sigma factor